MNGRDLNRVPLHEVVPRPIPFAIGIAPSDICNFKCIYCNQATEKGIADARILDYNDFLVIAKQVEDLVNSSNESLKIIRFIGNGEPLINKDLPKMIKLLSDKNLASRFEVTTNGSLLTHEMSDALIDAGLTRLLVSIQGVTEEKYRDICGYKINFEKFKEQLQYFYLKSRGKCTLFIKTVNVAIDSEEEEKAFFDMFQHICDDICVENIIPSSEGVDFNSMLSEEEFAKTRYGIEFKEKICCDTMFMYMNIHSNGDVDCCGCIYPPLYIGNVYKTPLSNIWNGKKHREYMVKHLTKKRCEIGVCSKCESITRHGGFEEDNLDEYLDEVLERVLNLQDK